MPPPRSVRKTAPTAGNSAEDKTTTWQRSAAVRSRNSGFLAFLSRSVATQLFHCSTRNHNKYTHLLKNTDLLYSVISLLYRVITQYKFVFCCIYVVFYKHKCPFAFYWLKLWLKVAFLILYSDVLNQPLLTWGPAVVDPMWWNWFLRCLFVWFDISILRIDMAVNMPYIHVVQQDTFGAQILLINTVHVLHLKYNGTRVDTTVDRLVNRYWGLHNNKVVYTH